PEPASRRGRPAGVDERPPARRGPRHRGLVYGRPPTRAPARGLAGDAGGDHRVHAEAGGVLRPKSRPRRAAVGAACRELPSRRERAMSGVEGRVALVTGATSGIGAATARALAAGRGTRALGPPRA